jgi:malate synthase
MPGFAAETAHIRNTEWKVDPALRDLTDRRVEITGPVDAKMIINALNSGAHVFMADFEDSNTPTWENNITGQLNLSAAIRRTLTFQAGGSEKVYSLNNKVATLMVRPRGWHLEEKHFLVDGRPTSASLFDFGLYFLHNAAALLERN